MSGRSKSADGPITIKKYANRRLYNTATSSYVTLDHLCEMVKSGQEFVVYDAKTNEDITRSVLTQIIFEEESKGQNLLPIDFLRQLIRFYGDQMQSAVPRYLEVSMQAFAKNQEQFRANMSDAFGGNQAFKLFEDMARQNAAIFQETWLEAYRRMMPFSPPGARPPHSAANGTVPPGQGVNGTGDDAAPPAAPEEQPSSEKELQELRAQMQAMQRRLDKMETGDSN